MNSIRNRCYIFLFLTITFFISTQEMSYATDTIYASQIFRDNDDTIVSTDGTFELGFFSPGDSNNRYVGIWYKKVAVMTVVWVANRDNPLTDRSGALRVVEPGLLVLLNHTNGIIWSTNTSSRVHTPVAQLLDSGNLVVRDANDDNPESFLWQSFNYPTDTLLPGMKLGWNFRTGLEVYITSSKSSDDLASGDFTFHCDPTGYPQGVLKNGTSVLYKTGPWNGLRFSGLQNLKKNNIFTFGMVISNNDAYYRYEALNDSVYTMLTLSESGDKQILIWDDQTKSWTIYITRPADYCDTYNVCGPYGSCNIKNSPACGCLKEFKPKDPQNWDREVWLKGCIRSTPLNCQKGDAFLKYSGIKLPDTQHSWYNNGMTLEECKVQCLLNCSCMAYASLDISRGGNGCLLWFGDLVDIKEIYPGQDIYIRMASSESDSERRKREILISRDSRRRTREIIIMTLSLVIGIPLLSLSLLLCTRQRKKLHHQQQRTGRLRLNYVGNNHDESHGDLELPLFDLSKITKATDNFSINNKLGQGGFGPVYKGLLEEGQEIAVKCLSRTSRQGVDEFKNEVISVAKLQHRNLVKLLGWCIQGEEMMLVYEYMVNKSLDLILFDPTTSILLDWPRRFNIINGIARGLMYLHQDSRLRVIHRDLKASNILLDSEMNPKISDFGLARILRGNETEANTNRIVGTYGYMSPEYAMGGLFSVKSDVFSYGVIVLEIVCGKKNRGFSHRDHLLNLLGHAWVLYREERSLELVDSCLRDSCYLSEVLRSVHIGLLCVQEHPEDRPIMSSVVLMLSNDSVLPEPKHPGFFTRRDILKINGTSASSGTATSQNAMSITLLEAR